MVLTDAFVSLGATDVSAYVRKVSVKRKRNGVENTRMAQTTKVVEGGVYEWNVNITWKQSFTAAEIDSILDGLFGTTFAVIVRPTSAVVGSGNPNYTGTAYFEEYSPIDASHGQLVEATTSFVSAGAMTRAQA